MPSAFLSGRHNDMALGAQAGSPRALGFLSTVSGMIHGPLEWVSVQDMAAATEVCLALAELAAAKPRK